MKQKPLFSRTFLFSEDRKRKLLALRERLRFLPNGIQARIANRVKCTRQTVHNVLYSYDDELAAKSDFAIQVWKELEQIINEPEVVQEYNTMKTIVEGLSNGKNVKIAMSLPKFRLIKRRLDKLGVMYRMDKSKGYPNSYTLYPESKAA